MSAVLAATGVSRTTIMAGLGEIDAESLRRMQGVDADFQEKSCALRAVCRRQLNSGPQWVSFQSAATSVNSTQWQLRSMADLVNLWDGKRLPKH